MRILVDENIAFGKEAFKQFGEVDTINGRAITNSCLKEYDVLLVRSITKVDAKLLANTKIKFIGTATIGTDHIDKAYLEEHGIAFSDAKGCNADSVTEYVFSALFHLFKKFSINPEGLSFGVVGIGNIGSRVSRIAEKLGFNVFKNDPPLQLKQAGSDYVSLDEIVECDIITLHVPLTMSGKYKTFHLFDNNNLSRLKENTIFINTSRGEVVDNLALLQTIKYKNIRTVLDVWENEPKINLELMDKVDITTPHIAGYSLEGKVNGTKILYDALCRLLNTTPSWQPVYPVIDDNRIRLDDNTDSLVNLISSAIKNVYDIESDSKRLKEVISAAPGKCGVLFDELRKNYPLRREFFNYCIESKDLNMQLKDILRLLRFKV